MRRTTTRQDIDLQLLELNRQLNRPDRPWLDGRAHGNAAQVGNIHLYRDHLGYRLYEMSNPSGGVRDVTYKVFRTKNELCLWLDGAIYVARQRMEATL